jgi:peptidoglycan L-alanyl-D-glutamate endopeptidase CwlK
MSVANQETTPARLGFIGIKRGKWLLMAVLAAMVIYLGAGTRILERWVPIGWCREVPKVTQLHPVVAANKQKLITQSEKIGIPIVITSDFRSSDEQDALYRKGRSDGGSIVTKVKGGQSYHNYGLAIDFALLSSKGKVIWDTEYDGNRNGKSDWMEVVAIAKKLGFTWGGDWNSFPDYPHLQMDFGYSIRELQWGWRPPAKDVRS